MKTYCTYVLANISSKLQVLGSDFAPFLPKVMGPVMRAASYKPDVAVLEGELETMDYRAKV